MEFLDPTNRTFRLMKVSAVVELNYIDHFLLLDGGHVLKVSEDTAESVARLIGAIDKIDACDLAEKGDHADAFFAEMDKARDGNGAG